MSLLGIDLGSGSCKGVVFDNSGVSLAQETREYSTYSLHPKMAEMDADCFWEAVVFICRQLAEKVGGQNIEALCVSSHGETIIPVDKDGNAISPAIMNSDNRADEQARRWERIPGRNRIYEITGLPLHAMYSLNKILWLKEHEPELYSRAERFVSVGDFILQKLGLPPYTDYSLASRTMAFDIRKKDWSEEILQYAGIDRSRFAIPMPAGQLVGKLSASTASLLGLRAGTAVALGGHDQPCGALGSGVMNSGEVADSAGTYECLTAVSSEPVNTPEALSFSLNSYCHVVPDRYVTLAFFPAGIVSRWFVEQLCFEDEANARRVNKRVFEILDAKMQEVCPGPSGLLMTPHFIGSGNPYFDVSAAGALYGLTPQVTRHHLYKAIYEGIACELRINTGVLEKICGVFSAVQISGGNARSRFTVELRAAMTQKAFQILECSDTVCLGAAMLAGVACGVYASAQEAAE
ncbi:MAG: FGGY family carbohydrate kinase, partial [Clostridia bacterium]|nr:FGGY family carbohydrate kinase [Clostridia bacterium]